MRMELEMVGEARKLGRREEMQFSVDDMGARPSVVFLRHDALNRVNKTARQAMSMANDKDSPLARRVKFVSSSNA